MLDKNPFFFENAIEDPVQFVGREELLTTLAWAMSSLHHVVIQAEKRMGKTSLLKFLEHPRSEFGLSDKHIPVYINYRTIVGEDIGASWMAVTRAICSELLRRQPGANPICRSFLTAMENIAETAQSLIQIIDVLSNGFNQLADAGFTIHLLLDDMEQTFYPETMYRQFFDVLFKLPNKTRNISYVMASRTVIHKISCITHPGKKDTDLSEKCKTIHMGLFSESEAYSLIVNYFDRCGLDSKLAQKLCADLPFIHQVTGFHPYLFQMFCHFLCTGSFWQDPQWPFGKARESALRSFEIYSEDYFASCWRLSSDPQREMIRNMLSDDSYINWQNPDETSVLDQLIQRGLVVETGQNHHRLVSSVFETWVKNEYLPNSSFEPLSTNEDNKMNQTWHCIEITQDTVLFVDAQTGDVLGPVGEGSLSLVLYGGIAEPELSDPMDLENQRAIRIPRLLQSEMLLNYHIVQTAFYEGKQAQRYSGDNYLLSPVFFHNLTTEVFVNIPNSDVRLPCFIGFHFVPGSRCKVCLISEDYAWPDPFKHYVKTVYGNTGNLYKAIKQQLRQCKANRMDGIVFLPDVPLDPQQNNSELSASGPNAPSPPHSLMFLGRNNLNQLYAENQSSGWWFNLPITGYPWMTADLQRLITAFLDDEPSNSGLATWQTDDWLELIQNLAQGLVYLHQKGGVHGDIRPANIMTNVPKGASLQPDQFRWIDLGLGQNRNSIFDEKELFLTSRLLDMGRHSAFYAKERNEVMELEDADMIRLQGDENGFSVKFAWRQCTSDTKDQARIIRLQENGLPCRELGRLQNGDRIQVDEFLFVVDSVHEDEIWVKHMFEVGFGRLLIPKTGPELRQLIQSLDGASISKYRILKNWSQATDIFGFGVLILYLFYVKGLFEFKVGFEIQDQFSSFAQNRLARESAFGEFIMLLKSQAFLESFMPCLNTIELDDMAEVWEMGHEEQLVEKLKKISDTLITMDAVAGLILAGTSSYRLFIQIIFLALACLWRTEDIREMTGTDDSEPYNKLQPLCTDRFGTIDDGMDIPMISLKQALDKIIRQRHKNIVLNGFDLLDRSQVVSDLWWRKMVYSQNRSMDNTQKIMELETSNCQLEAQIDQLEANKRDLESKIAEMDTLNSQLTLQVASLKNDHQDMEKEADQNDRADLEQKIDELEADNVAQAREIRNLERKLQENEDRYQQLMRQSMELEDTIDRLSAEKEKLQSQIATTAGPPPLSTRSSQDQESEKDSIPVSDENHAPNGTINSQPLGQSAQQLAALVAENQSLQSKLDELNTLMINLKEDIKNKRFVFQDLAERFNTTISGAYKRYSVDQFVEEVFIYMSQLKEKIPINGKNQLDSK